MHWNTALKEGRGGECCLVVPQSAKGGIGLTTTGHSRHSRRQNATYCNNSSHTPPPPTVVLGDAWILDKQISCFRDVSEPSAAVSVTKNTRYMLVSAVRSAPPAWQIAKSGLILEPVPLQSGPNERRPQVRYVPHTHYEVCRPCS